MFPSWFLSARKGIRGVRLCTDRVTEGCTYVTELCNFVAVSRGILPSPFISLTLGGYRVLRLDLTRNPCLLCMPVLDADFLIATIVQRVSFARPANHKPMGQAKALD